MNGAFTSKGALTAIDPPLTVNEGTGDPGAVETPPSHMLLAPNVPPLTVKAPPDANPTLTIPAGVAVLSPAYTGAFVNGTPPTSTASPDAGRAVPLQFPGVK